MTCNICREREATLFLQQSINGHDRRMQICGQCANEIQDGTIQATSLEQHERIDEARELMRNVGHMNMGMDDNFLQPFRDLMRRFNRPAIDRREQSFWDNAEWAWPFGRQAMRPLEQISIPDPETRKREDRASRLVFNEDGTVSLRGEEDGEGAQKLQDEHSKDKPEGRPEMQTIEIERREEPGQDSAQESELEGSGHDGSVQEGSGQEGSMLDSSEHEGSKHEEAKHEEPKRKDLTDIELIKMNFGELMHYTDEVSADERKTILARRRDLAVQEEDYELAAEIRDALRSLK